MPKERLLSETEKFKKEYEEINIQCFAPARQVARDERAKTASVLGAKGIYQLIRLISHTDWSKVNHHVKAVALQRVTEEMLLLETWSFPAIHITAKIQKMLLREDANYDWNLDKLTGIHEIITKTDEILFPLPTNKTAAQQQAPTDEAGEAKKRIAAAEVRYVDKYFNEGF